MDNNLNFIFSEHFKCIILFRENSISRQHFFHLIKTKRKSSNMLSITILIGSRLIRPERRK